MRSQLIHNSYEVEIILKSEKTKLKVRLIEFIEKGFLLKVQLMEKETEKVFAIPLERIEMLTKKPYSELPFLNSVLKPNDEWSEIKDIIKMENAPKTKKFKK